MRVRMGLHTGEPLSAGTGYVGIDVHRAARICAAGHGGQILLSETTRTLVEKELSDGVRLRDLGEHRLKDLADRLRVFEVVIADLPISCPPIRSLDAFPNNLPIQLTSFIGRKQEMGQVKELLTKTRLITLTGPGGCGKTRLALEVAAHQLGKFQDGVWLVDLAVLKEPILVPQAVASALGVREQRGRSLTETLVDYLRPKNLLLIMDGCEHLVRACAELAEAMLRGCPRLWILATSREVLGAAGEVVWTVPLLSLPNLRRLPPVERLAQYEAIKLFVDRAVANLQTFTVTVQNAPAVALACHRLDGIPLAIELAAARVKALSVEQIAERLGDCFRILTAGKRTALPRHQTLRAAMDWSYDLLSKAEQTLLRRASVFAGGFTLEAAEAVCPGDGVEAPEILDLLAHLMDKSLMLSESRDGEVRYRLLETVRQYGRGRLTESGEAADASSRHRDWFLALAERAERELEGPNQVGWLHRLETEHDNMRAALEWNQAPDGALQASQRLAAALGRFWVLRGYWDEGRRRLDGLLSRERAADPSVARARALCTIGDLQQSLAISQRVDDKAAVALTLDRLGGVAITQGDDVTAHSLYAESLAMQRELGNKFGIASSLHGLAELARLQGDYRQAAVLYAERLGLCLELGDRRNIAFLHHNFGYVALHQAHYGRAGTLFAESLDLFRELGDKGGLAHCIAGLAGVFGGEGRGEHAARLFGAARSVLDAIDYVMDRADRAEYDHYLAAVRAQLSDKAFATAWGEGQAMTLGQAITYAVESVTRDGDQARQPVAADRLEVRG